MGMITLTTETYLLIGVLLIVYGVPLFVPKLRWPCFGFISCCFWIGAILLLGRHLTDRFWFGTSSRILDHYPLLLTWFLYLFWAVGILMSFTTLVMSPWSQRRLRTRGVSLTLWCSLAIGPFLADLVWSGRLPLPFTPRVSPENTKVLTLWPSNRKLRTYSLTVLEGGLKRVVEFSPSWELDRGSKERRQAIIKMIRRAPKEKLLRGIREGYELMRKPPEEWEDTLHSLLCRTREKVLERIGLPQHIRLLAMQTAYWPADWSDDGYPPDEVWEYWIDVDAIGSSYFQIRFVSFGQGVKSWGIPKTHEEEFVEKCPP